MARANCHILDNGDMLPFLEVETVAGEHVVLPRDFGGRWAVLLFYRGEW